MKRLITSLVLVLALAACDSRDYGKCLQTESYTYLQPVMMSVINGIPIYSYLPMTGSRCVRWEFPEGRIV